MHVVCFFVDITTRLQLGVLEAFLFSPRDLSQWSNCGTDSSNPCFYLLLLGIGSQWGFSFQPWDPSPPKWRLSARARAAEIGILWGSPSEGKAGSRGQRTFTQHLPQPLILLQKHLLVCWG